MYALIAGFSSPTQRAMLMVLTFMMGELCQRQIKVWHRYGLSLVFVMMLNPFAVYLPGFYFSFFVVLIILSFRQNESFEWLRLQFIITLLLLPLTLYLFERSSLIHLPANLIAIPAISFIVLPLCFLLSISVFLSPIFSTLLIKILLIVKHYLFAYLSLLTSLTGLRIQYTISHAWEVVLYTSSAFFLLKIKGIKRFLSLFFLLPIFIFPTHHSLQKGEVNMTVLDVGQGLAVVLRTQQHVLLYDTGMGYPSGYDMAQAVILPYFHYHGIHEIDKLIISHDDIDHRGGLKSVLNAMTVKTRLDNEGSEETQNCHHHPSWSWDGVRFTFLFLPYRHKSDNNNSCVLMIDNGYQKTLLLGDIESQAEKTLIEKVGNRLQSNYMLVPHHGSKTSSSLALIKSVRPNYALVSTGRWNRYKFPHKMVMQRYQKAGIPVFNTSACGQIDWLMSRSNTPNAPRCFIRR